MYLTLNWIENKKQKHIKIPFCSELNRTNLMSKKVFIQKNENYFLEFNGSLALFLDSWQNKEKMENWNFSILGSPFLLWKLAICCCVS